MFYSSVMLRLWSSNKKGLDLLYSCPFGPCQKNCLYRGNYGNGLLITPATPSIKVSSITAILSILGKGLFLFPLHVDLGKARAAGGAGRAQLGSTDALGLKKYGVLY